MLHMWVLKFKLYVHLWCVGAYELKFFEEYWNQYIQYETVVNAG